MFVTLVTLILGVVFLVDYTTIQEPEFNLFHIYVNDTEVGTVRDPKEAEEWMLEARKAIASRSNELVFMEVSFAYTGAGKGQYQSCAGVFSGNHTEESVYGKGKRIYDQSF